MPQLPPNIYGDVLAMPAVDFRAVRDGRRAPIFYYDVDLSTARSIAAGSQLELPIAGDAFFCDLDPSNQGAAVVHVQDDALTAATAPIYCPPGAIVKAPYARLLIENAAQAGKRFRIFYGVGIDFSAGASGNVNVSGVVSTVDGGFNRTLAAAAFYGFPYAAAVAAQFTHVQLWNPPGSGKTLYVEQLNAYAQVSSVAGFSLRKDIAARASLYGSTSQNKLFSSAVASVSQLRYENNPAPQGAQFGTIINTAPFLKFTEPLAVTPGTGLTIMSGAVNQDLGANFEYYEQ